MPHIRQRQRLQEIPRESCFPPVPGPHPFHQQNIFLSEPKILLSEATFPKANSRLFKLHPRDSCMFFRSQCTVWRLWTRFPVSRGPGLDQVTQRGFYSATHLCANLPLARITDGLPQDMAILCQVLSFGPCVSRVWKCSLLWFLGVHPCGSSPSILQTRYIDGAYQSPRSDSTLHVDQECEEV